MASIKVLLAEDQRLLRKLLSEHLRNAKDFQVVGEASDGREAVRLAERTRPHVALLDYDMPLLSGGEAARQIRQRCPHTLNVILSDFPPTDMPWIDEWIEKTQVENISETLREIVGRHSRSDSTRTLPDEAVWSDLSDKQRNALRLLVNKGLSDKEIAARLSRLEGKKVSEIAVRKRLLAVMDKWEIEPRKRGRLIQVAETNRRAAQGRDESPV
jgi:DNA-binding NarL/FixJ family response regulator